jgi:hypothetical protein
MTIASPKERVYYYECSNGQFRLTYFIPPEELKRLSNEQRLSPRALKDHPDGVDLGCTLADFTEFEESYGYSPSVDPTAIQQAFFALLSSTRNWEKFRGAGFIPATDLERNLREVRGALSKAELEKGEVEPPEKELSLRDRQRIRRHRASRQRKANRILRALRVKGIDPKRSLLQQKFSRIKMTEGTVADEVFVRLHQKQQGR